jgi:Protein of unknown function (DUF3822)
MDKKILDIIEDGFSPAASMYYERSVLAGIDGFSYMINDDRQNILAAKAYSFANADKLRQLNTLSFQSFLLSDENLQHTVQKTRICFFSTDFTLIPSRLYDATKQKTYLNFLGSHLETNQTVRSDYVSTLDSYLVYAIPTDALTLANNAFYNATITHLMHPLINAFKKQAEHSNGHQVFINVREHHFQVLFFDGGNLIFCNSYQFATTQDFIYYILLIFDQFKLKPEITPVTLAGQVSQNSDLYNWLYRYIRNIYWAQLPVQYRPGVKMNAIPPYIFFDLYSLKLADG